MNRNLENSFFKEFGVDGAATMALEMAMFKYAGVGNGTSSRPDYPNGVLAEIKQRTENFNAWPHDGDSNNCPLFDEIDDNIRSCNSNKQEITIYVEYILRKLQNFAFLYSFRRDKLNAISNTVELYSLEHFFLTWISAYKTFGERLAFALAKRGINLLEIQAKNKISIIDRLDVNELWHYFGTIEAAENYLLELNHKKPEQPTQENTIEHYIASDDKETTIQAIKSLVCGKKGKQAAVYIYVAVYNGYMSKPTFDILKEAFGIIGTKQAFNTAYKNYEDKGVNSKEEEIEGAKTALKRKIEGV